MDSAAPGAELTFNIMAALSRHEWKRYQTNWANARRNAIRRGVHVSAFPPLGYRRLSKGEGLVIDELTAPFVRSLFERRARGEGFNVTCALVGGARAKARGFNDTTDDREPNVSRLCPLRRDCPGRCARGTGLPAALGRCECHDTRHHQVPACRSNGRKDTHPGSRDLPVVRASASDRHERPYAAHVLHERALRSANNIQVALLDAEVEDRVFGYIERLAPSTIKEVDPGRPDLKAAEAAEAALKDAEYARDKFLDNLEAISILGQARWNVQAAKYTKAVEVALGRLAAAEGQLAETRELSRVPLREEWPNLPLTRRREIIFTLVRTLVVAPVYGKRGVAGSERVKVRLMGGAMAKRWIFQTVHGSK